MLEITNSKPIIELSNVSFSYGKNLIINDSSLSIFENDFCCIVGENGSGKTTLLKLIIGLLRPSSGSVLLKGSPPEKLSHIVGHMPQKVEFDRDFPISVKEVVLMGRITDKLFFRPSKSDTDAVNEALQKVNMLEFERKQFSDLSGGQQQRVLIARAIASSPEILFFDEPTNSIDALSEDKLFEILKKLKGKMTVVMVSHNVRFVSELVEKVICVDRGQISIHKVEAIGNQTVKDLGVEHYKLIKHWHCNHSQGENNG